MPKERILITVKTYPTLSSSYGELVCTAGLREDGSWIRIYPIPFRSLNEYEKFEKYRFINASVIRNTKDPRPESHKIDLTSLEVDEEKLDTRDCWRERRKWVLGSQSTIHTDLATIIHQANKENSLSLVTFKPTRILDFIVEEETERYWDATKLEKLASQSQQDEMFAEFQPEKLTKLIDKLPYKFSYKLEDSEGKVSQMMIEDWEIGMLYWNSLKASSSEKEAIEKVRQKYFDTFSKKDLYLFLGTTRQWHGIGSVWSKTHFPPNQVI